MNFFYKHFAIVRSTIGYSGLIYVENGQIFGHFVENLRSNKGRSKTPLLATWWIFNKKILLFGVMTVNVRIETDHFA